MVSSILANYVWSSKFLTIKPENQFRVCANLLKQWGILVVEIVVELISWLVEILAASESPQESIVFEVCLNIDLTMLQKVLEST